jgi:hypothetical protein
VRLGGFEPPTRGLEGREHGSGTQRRTSTNALNHAGFRRHRVREAAWATNPPIKPHRIQYVRIALSRNTVELPWASRAPLLERVREHDAGLQVVLAFEAVGATLHVRLEPAGKRVLLQVVEAWLSQANVDGLPPGVWELRNELQDQLRTASSRASRQRQRLKCAECGAISPPDAAGWRAYLDDDDRAVMFCPSCAEREFGATANPNRRRAR